MPLPTPNRDEPRTAFMSRCLAYDGDDVADMDQAEKFRACAANFSSGPEEEETTPPEGEEAATRRGTRKTGGKWVYQPLVERVSEAMLEGFRFE